MSKTIKISDRMHKKLRAIKLRLSATREKEQTFNDALEYLIKREKNQIEQEVDLGGD